MAAYRPVVLSIAEGGDVALAVDLPVPATVRSGGHAHDGGSQREASQRAVERCTEGEDPAVSSDLPVAAGRVGRHSHHPSAQRRSAHRAVEGRVKREDAAIGSRQLITVGELTWTGRRQRLRCRRRSEEQRGPVYQAQRIHTQAAGTAGVSDVPGRPGVVGHPESARGVGEDRRGPRPRHLPHRAEDGCGVRVGTGPERSLTVGVGDGIGARLPRPARKEQQPPTA